AAAGDRTADRELDLRRGGPRQTGADGGTQAECNAEREQSRHAHLPSCGSALLPAAEFVADLIREKDSKIHAAPALVWRMSLAASPRIKAEGGLRRESAWLTARRRAAKRSAGCRGTRTAAASAPCG